MKWLLVVICIASGLVTQVAFAVDAEFRIDTRVGIDVTPPSTPLNVVATTVSTTQINLTWDASTDDFLVDGYQVFRDAVQVATTSLTNYSDTGLTASTTYTYAVRAFDTSANFSTTSATTSATTLPPAPTTTPTTTLANDDSGATATRITNELSPIIIDVTTTEARVSFTTSQPSQVSLAWGRSSDYELGYSAGAVLQREHSIWIQQLSPGTLYELKITVRDRLGRESVITKTFTTAAAPDTTAPANPMNVIAVRTKGGIELSWENPVDEDFAFVRVLSNDQFYPTDPYAGYLVYEGPDSGVVDERVAVSMYRYYTLFAYDEAGNVSSGAVVRVLFEENTLLEDGEASSTPTTSVPMITLDFSDIQFLSNGKVLPTNDGTVYIPPRETILISIPYDLLPERLKTIVVRIKHPYSKNSEFAFLLRVNADKTAYEARIGALGTPGVYAFSAEIFDYQTKRLSEVAGTLTVQTTTVVAGGMSVSRVLLLGNLLFLLLVVIFLLYRSRRKSEDSLLYHHR